MYENSSLYHKLKQEHSKEEVDAIFDTELQKRNITDYEDFVKNYKREYNYETIVKYVDLVSYFQLDRCFWTFHVLKTSGASRLSN
jgi:hypothetical protein